MADRHPDATDAADAAILASLGVRGLTYLAQLQAAGEAQKIALWLDIGDALGAGGRWDRARLAWERGRSLAEASRGGRGQAVSFYWRLGQLAEGQHQLAEAATWYERAADAFARDEAPSDEAVARMALARIAFHLSGAGHAAQAARQAVLAAKGAHDAVLLGDALELAAEIELDLGQHDDAIAGFRDAARQHRLARAGDEAGGQRPGESLSPGEVRAGVGLAEALLESGQALAALRAYEAVEAFVEGHDSVETRGRGLGVLGLLKLEVGNADEAVEPLKQAHELLDSAGAFLRRARLYVAMAQRIERLQGAVEAKESYERAWFIAKRARDPVRMAPIGYALARCYLEIGQYVRADEVLGEVMRQVQDAGDLEGMVRVTELGVRVAIRLAQGKMALERMLLLARTRGRMGDRAGQVHTLRSALEVTLVVPDTETEPVATEFLEALRETGTGVLGPAETMEIAEALAKGKMLALASEVAQMEAARHLSEARRSEGARTLVKAAVWSLRAGERWTAVDLWEQALAIAHELGLPEIEAWKVERTLAAEG